MRARGGLGGTSKAARTPLQLVAWFALTAVAGCHARPRTWSAPPPELGTTSSPSARQEATGGEIDEIDLTAGAPEAAAGLLAGLAHKSSTYFDLVSAVKAAADESDSKGVLVRFGGARIGWARAEELGALLGAVRAAKKPVVCHADAYTNTTAWVALRGCDRIWVSPAGEIATVGIAAQILYANRLLTKKLGIDVDFLQIGQYKGAEEPLTRDGPSPEARASLEGALAAIRKRWLADATAAREKVQGSLEDGPFSPEEAKNRGLVDAVGYPDEARDDAKKLAHVERYAVRFGASARNQRGLDVPELVRVFSGGGGRTATPHVAVVNAIGAIAMGRSGGLSGGDSGISEQRLGRMVRNLTDDKSVRAVVLRIDSPGGSALASDLLWHDLMLLREKKPIVVSVGDMAASGGYYLASTGTKIVAEPTSIVGSIGVVGGKLAFGGALESIGVHAETFTPVGAASAAARAAYESPFIAWDDPTRARVRASMTAVYDLFLARVAEGRKVSVARVAESAEGRIFAGDEAKERGLVDEWGGIDRAIVLARELGNLPPEAPALVTEQPSSLWDLLALDDDDASGEKAALGALGQRAKALAPLAARLSGMGGESAAGDVSDWLRANSGTDGSGSPARALGQLEEGARATVAGAAATAPELFAFLDSLLPLAFGERTLTAIPFLILVR